MKSVTERITAILTSLKDVDGEISAAQISRKVNLPVQTVHRLLGELAVGGLVRQNQRSKQWSLGPMIISLGAAAKRQINLISIARPYLETVTESSRETTILTVRDGLYGTYIDIVESPEKVRLVESIGMRLPLVTGASRRAILAFLMDNERETVVNLLVEQGHQFDVRELYNECIAIRRLGYALSAGQVTPGTIGITVPIFSEEQPIGSITIGGPEYRLNPNVLDELVSLLLEAARSINSHLSR